MINKLILMLFGIIFVMGTLSRSSQSLTYAQGTSFQYAYISQEINGDITIHIVDPVNPANQHDLINLPKITGTSRLYASIPSPNGVWIAIVPESAPNAAIRLVNVLTLETHDIPSNTGIARGDDSFTLGPRLVAAWSPNSLFLAFNSSHEGQRETYIYDTVNQQINRLTNDTARQGDLAWSPDSTRLAVFSQTAFEVSYDRNLEVFNVETGQLEITTSLDHIGTGGLGNLVCQLGWSPDGQYISFAASCDGSFLAVTKEVYILDTVQGNLTAVTTYTAIELLDPNAPVYDPIRYAYYDPLWLDAQTLLIGVTYRDTLDTFKSETILYNVANGTSSLLTNEHGQLWTENPATSELAFLATQGESIAVDAIRIASFNSGTLNVTKSLPAGCDLEWSPDGTILAYTYRNSSPLGRCGNVMTGLAFFDPSTGQTSQIAVSSAGTRSPVPVGWIRVEGVPSGDCDHNVPANAPPALVTAIVDANTTPEPDTICLMNSTYTFANHNNASNGPNALPAITSDITIIGNGATLERSGSNNFRFFMVEAAGNLTLENLTITGGNPGPGWRGGNIRNHGTLTLNAVTLSNGNAPYGGSLYATSGGSVTIEDSTITTSNATVGGGINVNSGTLTMSDSTVTVNTAATGAGMYVGSSGTGNLTNVLITQNTSNGWGGGIHNDGTLEIISLSGITRINNNIARNGAGISNNGGSLTLREVEVSNNQIPDGSNGGGLYIVSGTVSIHDSAISFNTAPTNGGGIWNGGDLSLYNVSVYGNQASHGGGILNEGRLVINDGSITENSLTDDGFGGGLDLNSNQEMTINDAYIEGNSARNGAGIYVVNGTVNLDNTRFFNNTGVNGVGIFVNNGATANITYGTFSGNIADDQGGAILSAGNVNITSSYFTGNHAGIRGGAIYTSAGTASITGGSCIYGNTSSNTSGIFGHASGVTASGNWWGAANGPSGSGPGSGDGVNQYVDFSNFLTTAPGC